MDIKAVIFDLGRVVIDFDHTIAAKRIAPFTGKSPREIYNLFFDSGITVRFEAGQLSPEAFFAEVKALLGLSIGFQEFLPIWNEIFFITDKNKEVYAVARQLRARYTVAMLSNINVLHFEYLQKHFPIFDAFNYVFTSCGLGYVKPDIRIYQEVLKRLACAPQEAFYTDDRPELVESARSIGIKSFVFMDPQKLLQDLAAAGIRL